MRVVMNTLVTLGRRTGIGNYACQLLRCLRTQATGDEIDEFPGGWAARWSGWGFRGRRHLEHRQPGRAGWRSWCLGRLRSGGQALLALHFRATARRRGYDLYHEPNYIPLPCDLPTVATVHDLSIVLHPEWHPADRVAYYEKHFQRGLARCTHLLADSEHVRQEMIRHLGIRPERVTRTYMGIKPGLRPVPPAEVAATLHRLGLPPRYLLAVGTIEPRKNVLRLLHAYCALPDLLRAQWPLLLVGGWGWNTADVAMFYHAEARHRGVIHVGYLPDEDLPAVYSGARALVYPSLYEGFGLPPIEMMACGGAVVASTAGAVAEVVGSRVPRIDPLDVAGWRDAMRRVVEDDDWWQELRRGAEAVARPFSWERCAAATLQVYRTVISGAATPLLRAAG